MSPHSTYLNLFSQLLSFIGHCACLYRKNTACMLTYLSEILQHSQCIQFILHSLHKENVHSLSCKRLSTGCCADRKSLHYDNNLADILFLSIRARGIWSSSWDFPRGHPWVSLCGIIMNKYYCHQRSRVDKNLTRQNKLHTDKGAH